MNEVITGRYVHPDEQLHSAVAVYRTSEEQGFIQGTDF